MCAVSFLQSEREHSGEKNESGIPVLRGRRFVPPNKWNAAASVPYAVLFWRMDERRFGPVRAVKGLQQLSG